MSAPARTPYHHGDLRAALVAAAMRLLEQGKPFSLRAVAREVGVSPTAPYRHFADRDALESAVAAEGFGELKQALNDLGGLPGSPAELAEFGVAYITFALERPALFRVMFGKECDDTNDQRVRAAGALHELLAAALGNVYPGVDPADLSTALWSMVHGLAFLHLDGKLTPSSPEVVRARVHGAFRAVRAMGAAER